LKSTIAIFASSRRHGNTGQLMDVIAKELGIEVLDLNDYQFSDFDYEYKNKNDDFYALFTKVLAYDHIIFASPVYWYSVSPPMKRFLDRISDFLTFPELLDTGRQLRGKTGYVVCTSISEEVDTSFINAFKDTFEYLGMHCGGYIHCDCSNDFDLGQHQAVIKTFIKELSSTANA
jgi:multimeric flavodoxin WrbA